MLDEAHIFFVPKAKNNYDSGNTSITDTEKNTCNVYLYIYPIDSIGDSNITVETHTILYKTSMQLCSEMYLVGNCATSTEYKNYIHFLNYNQY